MDSQGFEAAQRRFSGGRYFCVGINISTGIRAFNNRETSEKIKLINDRADEYELVPEEVEYLRLTAGMNESKALHVWFLEEPFEKSLEESDSSGDKLKQLKEKVDG